MEEILYFTKPQGQLPKINGILYMKDAFDKDDKGSNFKVKRIKELEWNEITGELMITVCGEYV